MPTLLAVDAAGKYFCRHRFTRKTGNNGGHHQYFWNSRGCFVDLVEKGLQHFGAKKHLQIFREALSRYDPKRYEAEQREADWKKGFRRGYDEKRFEDLDTRYYKSVPKLGKVIETYIRKNIQEFRDSRTFASANEPSPSR